eukprot:7897-Heterococcus_DN1.PRE.1
MHSRTSSGHTISRGSGAPLTSNTPGWCAMRACTADARAPSVLKVTKPVALMLPTVRIFTASATPCLMCEVTAVVVAAATSEQRCHY